MNRKILYIITILFVFASFTITSEKSVNDKIIKISIQDFKHLINQNIHMDRLFIKDKQVYIVAKQWDLKILAMENIHYSIAQNINRSLQPKDAYSVNYNINGAYHSYSETVEYLQQLAAMYPDLTNLRSIGQSLENREIWAISIGLQNAELQNKPNIVITGCHHAREWISVEVPLLFARYLLENYGSNPTVQSIVNSCEINIIPIVNPDGLEYSLRYYRMWRKNRRPVLPYAHGVDLNRNYGYMWGNDDVGSSPNPYYDTYRGSAPFSEPETQVIRDFMLSNPPAGLLSYHNYSQIIIYPWGHKNEPAPHYQLLSRIANGMALRMTQVNGNVYETGSTSEGLYPVNGNTTDWVYGTFRVPAYTVELPPAEFLLGGFITPESIIQSTFQENVPGIMYFIDECLKITD